MEREEFDRESRLPAPEIHLDLPHGFELVSLDELPGHGGDVHYFPPGRVHGQDGVLLRVIPEGGEPWIGLFAAQPGGRHMTAVYSCPDPYQMCVISNGAAYVLDVRDRSRYAECLAPPVTGVATAAHELVLANETDVVALDAAGRRWLAERVSFDGIRSLRIERETVRGLAWSPMHGEYEFRLDLKSGRRLG